MYPRSELFVCSARFFSSSVTAAKVSSRILSDGAPLGPIDRMHSQELSYLSGTLGNWKKCPFLLTGTVRLRELFPSADTKENSDGCPPTDVKEK